MTHAFRAALHLWRTRISSASTAAAARTHALACCLWLPVEDARAGRSRDGALHGCHWSIVTVRRGHDTPLVPVLALGKVAARSVSQFVLIVAENLDRCARDGPLEAIEGRVPTAPASNNRG